MDLNDKSMHKQHQHAHREHTEWLETAHAWRAEHQRALAQLARLQAMMMEHNAEIEEIISHIHRHEQHIAHHERAGSAQKSNGGLVSNADLLNSHADLNDAHREVRAKLKRMVAVHSGTAMVLEEVIEQLHDVRMKVADDFTITRLSSEENIRQASFDSFPASDPPSFNPGHT